MGPLRGLDEAAKGARVRAALFAGRSCGFGVVPMCRRESVYESENVCARENARV